MNAKLTKDLALALKASICAEPIIDSNGICRDQYSNSHQLMSSPDLLLRCSKVLLSEALRLGADQLVGLAIGGCALAGTMAALSDETQRPLAVSMFRDRPKTYGYQGYLGCSIPNHHRVCIVDDVISTGKSALRAIEHLRTLDIDVVGALSVVRRGDDGISAYCSRIFLPASFTSNPSRMYGASLTVAGMFWVAKGGPSPVGGEIVS